MTKKEINWESDLEHVVKYQLTTDFVTDKQILTKLFSKLLSQEREKIVEEIKNSIEVLADIEHTRWSKWQNYLHQKLDFSTGKYVLSESDFEHWNRQIHTPYPELSEAEKESDREEARNSIDAIIKHITL